MVEKSEKLLKKFEKEDLKLQKQVEKLKTQTAKNRTIEATKMLNSILKQESVLQNKIEKESKKKVSENLSRLREELKLITKEKELSIIQTKKLRKTYENLDKKAISRAKKEISFNEEVRKREIEQAKLEEEESTKEEELLELERKRQRNKLVTLKGTASVLTTAAKAFGVGTFISGGENTRELLATIASTAYLFKQNYEGILKRKDDKEPSFSRKTSRSFSKVPKLLNTKSPIVGTITSATGSDALLKKLVSIESDSSKDIKSLVKEQKLSNTLKKQELDDKRDTREQVSRKNDNIIVNKTEKKENNTDKLTELLKPSQDKSFLDGISSKLDIVSDAMVTKSLFSGFLSSFKSVFSKFFSALTLLLKPLSLIPGVKGLSKVVGGGAKLAKTGGKAVSGIFDKALGVVGKLGSAVSKLAGSAGGFVATNASKISKVGGKSLLKKIPVAGALVGGGLAVGRGLEGDFTGAAMELGSGLSSIIPGFGTAGSVAMDAALMKRDYDKQNQQKPDANQSESLIRQELNKRNISDPVQQANIIAQAKAESNLVPNKQENLRYKPERLLEVFPKKVGNLSNAKKVVDGGQESIGNVIYGGRMGNKQNEGFKYRGRGLIQLTGKSNYEKYSKLLGVDLVNNPDLLLKPEISAAVTAEYFKQAQNSGTNLNNVDSVSKAVGFVPRPEEFAKRRMLAQQSLVQPKIQLASNIPSQMNEIKQNTRQTEYLRDDRETNRQNNIINNITNVSSGGANNTDKRPMIMTKNDDPTLLQMLKDNFNGVFSA